MRSNNLLILLSNTLLAILVASCNSSGDRDDTTKVKTLDSIGSGNTKLHQCSGGNPVLIKDEQIIFDTEDPKPLSVDARKEVVKAVKDYFSALPESVQLLYLTKMGGNIFISSRADSLCEVSHTGRNIDTANKETVSGCFNFLQDPAGVKTNIFTIVHSQNPIEIRYYGPQIFGYLYAQLYPRLVLNSAKNGLLVTPTEPMELITLKENIANAFLNDMLASPIYEVSTLKSILGENSAAELNTSSNLPPLNRLTFQMPGDAGSLAEDVKLSRRKQVLDYIYANTYQSLHCTAETKASATKNFDRTSEIFDQVDVNIDNLSRQLIGASGSAQPSRPAPANLNLTEGGLLGMFMPILGGMGGMSGAGVNPTYNQQGYGPAPQGYNQQGYAQNPNQPVGYAANGAPIYNTPGNQSAAFSSVYAGPPRNANASIGTPQQQNPFGMLFAMLSGGGCPGCGGRCDGSCGGGCCSKNVGSGSCPGCTTGCCNCNTVAMK